MTSSTQRTPVHLWIVGVVSLLWNAVGCFDYLATKIPIEGYMEQFSEAQLAWFHGVPAWFTVFWALGTWGALAGSLGLLLRRRWAVAAFAVSLLGLIVTTVYTVFLSDGVEIMGAEGAAFSAVIFIIAVFLLLYARRMAAVGVLR
ncbi:MAG: hypothetical protein ACNS61_08695 [Candidatus Wenzhouxiangella sp. M2_3B_020]